MAEILIETKPVSITTYEHLYLVFRDDGELETVIRGGPENNNPLNFGNILTQVGLLIEDSKDAREDKTPADRFSTLVNLGGREANSVWSIMLQQAQNIGEAGLNYNALFGVQNSNSTIASVLNSVGIDINSNLPQGKVASTFPGINNLLNFDTNLIGTPDIDIIRGGEGNDNLRGELGNDTLYGDADNDTLDGGTGNDFLEGGLGEDIAIFSDDFENYEYSISDDEDFITINHISGTQTDGKDTLRKIEFARFGSGIFGPSQLVPLPLRDGVENTTLIEIPNPAPSINNPNDLHAANYLGLTSPISMLDGDVESTVHYSLVPPGEPYNIAFIIDTSASMDVAELEEVKNAYINLTNYFIANEIAENSNFAVINFSRNAVLQPNLTAQEAILAIQNLTPSTNGFEGTKYNDALFNAQLFFLQSPLDIGKENNIAFFTSDGKSQHNFFDPNDESYVYDAMALRGVANVQAFGIDDGTNAAGAVSQGQLNFVDSDNGLIISDASELTVTLGKSGLIDNLEELQILKDSEIVQTIAANELTDSPLGLSFDTTIDELNVSLGAENTLTVQASFIDETTSPGSDFIVASGLTPSNIEPLTNIASGSSGNDELLLGLLDLGAEGGEGDDEIIANSYDNLLDGGEGNDTISGHGGNDTITPGNGADQVNGGDGIDTVVYEDQEFAAAIITQAGRIINLNNSDTLIDVEFIQFSDVRISTETLEVFPILEGSNITLIEGNSGTTIAQFTINLTTAAPVDILFDYNTVDGNAISGEDYLAASGRMTIAAGETSGIVEVEVTADEVFEQDEGFGLTLSNISGATFANNEAEYTLVANIENDDIEVASCNPTTGDDDLTDCATSGDDTINGLEGNDTIVGLAGDDSLDGQADNDSLNGGDGNDSLLGSNGDDTLIGEQGNDSLLGGNHDDSLNGGNGQDTLNGGNGADILLGQNNDDTLNAGNGNDTLNGGAGADKLYGQNDDDTLNGSNGNDTLGGGFGADKLFGQNDDDRLVGNDGNDTLGGGSGADILLGQNDDDTLNGGDGNDTLSGGTGADKLFGQNDDDTLNGGDGNDTLGGGTGADKLFGQNDDDALNGNDGNDTLNGGAGADKLYGQNDEDILNGGDGNDTLSGGTGADKLFGQNDNDTLNGGDGNDTLGGGFGADKLYGQNDDDRLWGGDGNDTLGGGFGADKLFGQNDDDRLVGGLGVDSLTGGAGNDRFVIVSGLTGDRDIIQDYQDGFDLLDLTGGLTFDNLTINQSGDHTNIIETATNETLATLIGIEAVTINDSDFV